MYLFMRVRVAGSIDYRLDNRTMEVRVPAEEILSLLQKGQTPYVAHSDSYPKRVEVYIIEDKAVGA